MLLVDKLELSAARKRGREGARRLRNRLHRTVRRSQILAGELRALEQTPPTSVSFHGQLNPVGSRTASASEPLLRVESSVGVKRARRVRVRALSYVEGFTMECFEQKLKCIGGGETVTLWLGEGDFPVGSLVSLNELMDAAISTEPLYDNWFDS